MIIKKDDEILIYFLDEKIIKHINKGIIALLLFQIINIIYILVNNLSITLFDLGFSYVVILFVIIREIAKKKLKIPDIVLKNKKIILGDIQIETKDVIEIKKFYTSLIISHKVNDIQNMIKIYSSDSKEKREEIYSCINAYVNENKENNINI